MRLKNFLNGRARKFLLFFIDLFCYLFVDVTYFLFRKFDPSVADVSLSGYFINSLILMAVIFLLRFAFGLHRSIWRYTDTGSYLKLIISDGCAGVLSLLVSRILEIFFKDMHVGAWFFITVPLVTTVVTLSSRFAYRMVYKRANQDMNLGEGNHKIPVAIVGAGQIGVLLAEELMSNKKSNYEPMFFIDRDKYKKGQKLQGLKVYYEDDSIIDFIQSREVKEIFIAIAGLSNEETAKIYNFYKQTSCKVKIYDTSVKSHYSSGGANKRQIREFQIEDLLFRKSLNINNGVVASYYADKTILVTGGGGSIGSELCRQIAKCSPKKLIILDIYENNAYEIQQELIREYKDKLDLAVEIASVRDVDRLECVFKEYRPDIVFHAAAHKHVPLMEHSNCEAIKNNILGTYNTANMAEKYGVSKFILISTDKAVNPTNIMGASKRMCEMVIQCRKDSKTSFAAVRFGNVLGSNGSVIPLFKNQIARGGPVTITDKRIIRYFMTIPEASQLVMHAGAMAEKGELFVLDMGKPVKIYDLAVNMIKLSGLEPDVDIKIEEIGLRPGEKLYEELLMKTETLDKTSHEMIFIEKDTPLTRESVDEKIAMLMEAVDSAKGEIESKIIVDAMKKAVSTYHSAKSVNLKAESSDEMRMIDPEGN